MTKINRARNLSFAKKKPPVLWYIIKYDNWNARVIARISTKPRITFSKFQFLKNGNILNRVKKLTKSIGR